MGHRGITLIALVITIIVLLILAAVSIATLTGENGILSQAEKASEQTEIGGEKEAIGLAYNGGVAEKNGDTNITAKDMNDQFRKNGTNAEASENIKIHFLDSNRWYKLESNGNILGPYASEEEIGTTLVEMFKKAQEDSCEGGESCSNPEEHLHIGDYVSYNPIATGDTLETLDDDGELKYQYESLSSKNGYTNLEKQVYSVNNDTEKVNWIVLGISEDGNSLLITTGSPVRKEGTNSPSSDDPYLYLYGSTGYINAESELNNISAIYGKGDYATGARSITVEDINKLTGYNPETEKDNEVQLNEYGNTVTIKGNGDGTYSWSNATNGYKNGTFLYNHATNGFCYIENNQFKNISTNDTTTTANLTNSCYSYGAFEYIGENSKIYKKFFDIGDNNYYWLGSRVVSINENFTYFDLLDVRYQNIERESLFYSEGDERSGCSGVRPVVTLQSGVTTDEIQILEEQTEPEW